MGVNERAVVIYKHVNCNEVRGRGAIVKTLNRHLIGSSSGTEQWLCDATNNCDAIWSVVDIVDFFVVLVHGCQGDGWKRDMGLAWVNGPSPVFVASSPLASLSHMYCMNMLLFTFVLSVSMPTEKEAVCARSSFTLPREKTALVVGSIILHANYLSKQRRLGRNHNHTNKNNKQPWANVRGRWTI